MTTSSRRPAGKNPVLGAGLGAGLAAACVFAFTATVARAAIFDCVIDPSLTIKLGSPIASILSTVDVERGDFVKQGQPIAQLASAVERATVAVNEARASSNAEIAAKMAMLEQRRGVLARKVGLQRSNYASAQDIDTAQADFNVAEQELATAKLNRHMAELELQRARAELEQRTIRSPIDGIIVKRALGPGEYVHQEASIVTMARIDPLNVETFLPIRYYGLIKVGDMAEVRPDEPVGGQRSAAVTVVDEVFDAASGTFGVRLTLPNPEHIVPAGLRCHIGFDIPEPAVRAPAVALGSSR